MAQPGKWEEEIEVTPLEIPVPRREEVEPLVPELEPEEEEAKWGRLRY